MRLPVALGNNNMEYLSKTYCILVYLFLRCNSKFEDYGDRVKSQHSVLKLSVALNVRHDRRCWTPVLNLSNPGGQTGRSQDKKKCLKETERLKLLFHCESQKAVVAPSVLLSRGKRLQNGSLGGEGGRRPPLHRPHCLCF